MKSNHAHSGFTLTEFAIVLGMLGFVLSAIWSVYSQAIVNYNASILGQDITYIANQYTANNTFQMSSFPSSAPCAGGWCSTTNSDTAAMALSGVVPPDMFKTATSPMPLKNHFGGTPTVMAYSGAAQPSGNPASVSAASLGAAGQTFHNDIIIDTGLIPTAACTKILMSNWATWEKYGFEQLYFNNGAVNVWFGDVTPLGANLATIESGCSNSNPVDVMLYFCWGPNSGC